jgi:ABC-2 type transport system ATP-binding protein
LVITLTPEQDMVPVRLEVDGATITEQAEARLVIQFDPERVSVATLIQAVIAQHPVSDISIVEPDLEGVVRHITENSEALA